MHESKEIYLAGRLDTGEGAIGEFAHELEGRGHSVPEKWWDEGRLPKPYLSHLDTSAPAAKAMVDAAYNSDIYVLFPTDDILGAAVELGAALGSRQVRDNKEIIIVNPFEVRQSVFYAHPAIIAVRSLAQIRGRSWY